ncbi:MAG TPA: Stf0 family sulfotransferase [Caulobacteraceae bacterium]
MARPPVYDLVTAAGDYPPWDGPPRRTVVICSHMRSGSTLLGEALREAGGVGTALEYFHRGFRPTLQARWGAASLDDYVRAVHRHRTDPSGVLGVKLFWMDLEDLAHERDPEGQPPEGQRLATSTSADDYRRIFALVRDIFPNPTFVHLRRQDRVRQAVSHLTAIRTGLWRSIDGDEREASGPADYDYERIGRIIAAARRAHAHWAGLFAALGVQPYAITYEQLARDYQGTLGGLLRFLGAASGEAPPLRTRPQADAASEAMAIRFVKEDAARRA